MWIKAQAVNQQLLLIAHPQRFFVPPYVGPSGWVGIYLDGKPDWAEVADRLAHAHELASAVSRPRQGASGK
jgi:predicted DNA-binding protein (MmcQ/YjbR family)